MKYLHAIQDAVDQPERLELLYQGALHEGASAEFRADLVSCRAAAPDNLLYSAWFHRFEHTPDEAAGGRRINWALAVPVSLCTGLVLWLLSDDRFRYSGGLPYLILYAAPIVAVASLIFLGVTARRYALAGAAGGVLAILTLYVFLLTGDREAYRQMMVPHLFLFSWAAVGAALLGWNRSPRQVFAFLIKSIEVVVTGGVYLIATAIFAGLAIAMFNALNLNLPNSVIRLAFFGLGGMVPVLAIASVYDPLAASDQQEFCHGVGRLIVTFPRILLGLTLVVLLIYLAVIPFNFMAPFQNRDVLIAYNGMLFAVMGLLVGATPVTGEGLSPRLAGALRAGIAAVAAIVTLISLYALAAVVWRALGDTLTLNRLTVIGWNTVNVAALGLLLFRQARLGRAAAPPDWIAALHRTFADSAWLYLAWGAFVLLVTRWLF